MANEITVSASLRVTNGNLNESISTGTLQFTQAASGGPTPGYVTIGTSEESFTFPELTTEGWCYLKNIDSTNYVQWGFSTGVYGGRLEANEFALFRLEPSVTLYMKANTANCKCIVKAFED